MAIWSVLFLGGLVTFTAGVTVWTFSWAERVGLGLASGGLVLLAAGVVSRWS